MKSCTVSSIQIINRGYVETSQTAFPLPWTRISKNTAKRMDEECGKQRENMYVHNISDPILNTLKNIHTFSGLSVCLQFMNKLWNEQQSKQASIPVCSFWVSMNCSIGWISINEISKKGQKSKKTDKRCQLYGRGVNLLHHAKLFAGLGSINRAYVPHMSKKSRLE